jgi:glycosyltransferase involved in cell wall biosynthesis
VTAPRFSVVVPTYERAPVIGRAVASVLAQTWEDFELLVADDGSRDDTRKRIEAFDDPRIRYLWQENRGVSAARNLGIGEARGEIVTFLDSDGEAEPGWLAAFAEAFSDPAVTIACAGATVVRGQTGREELLLPEDRGPVYAHRRVRFAPPGTLAVRRWLLDEVGGYVDELRYSENSELAMRLFPHADSQDYGSAAIYRSLVRYSIDPDGWSGDPRRHALMRAGAELVLERHGERLRILDPPSYAAYASVAAINAARVGDVTAARRHLAAATQASPWQLKNRLRWLLTWVPPLARRFWSRHVTVETRGAT